MTRIQALVVLVIYLIGAALSMQWAVSREATAVLGLILWTSFYGFINAVIWAIWWSREHWAGK